MRTQNFLRQAGKVLTDFQELENLCGWEEYKCISNSHDLPEISSQEEHHSVVEEHFNLRKSQIFLTRFLPT